MHSRIIIIRHATRNERFHFKMRR